ncbi:hypothetical protein G6F47_012131 [Rhizopus delemar]|nr:hypothetical protein G6F54_012644 [Rhizopus delemar]KAG1493883.1 hypothetical protein G6F53_012672 [Rhizopus delemar]KAG1582821.1 hypothetical protein G6F47_012131 [Rhizopus delemar]
MPSASSSRSYYGMKSVLHGSRTAADIYAELHILPSLVYRYTKKLKVKISSSQLGRPPIVPDVTKNYMKIQIIRGQLQIAKDVYRLPLEPGLSILHSSTVNALESTSFHVKLKKKKPFLTKEHTKRKLS